MLNKIRKEVESLKGKNIKIVVDVGRNKSERYEGFILETYDNVWTFKTKTDIKSFGYNDILINSVIIVA